VTLDQWRTSTVPHAMLSYLRGLASERNFWLVSAAFCRQALDLMADERSRRAVEMVERFADGLVSPDELAAASEEAHSAYRESAARADELEVGQWADDDWLTEAARHAASAAYSASRSPRRHSWDRPGDQIVVLSAVSFAVACKMGFAAGARPGKPWCEGEGITEAARLVEQRDLVPLVHCIFGDPFHPTKFDESWRTPPVIRLAAEAYRNPATEILRVLSDCIEEAGCQDPVILGHCRGDTHARGCWVLDLILGKE
jgi:hypothetical protein